MISNLFRIEFQTDTSYNQYIRCNGNCSIGVRNELPQVFLAICDTNIQPFTYTGSEIFTLQITEYR